MSHRQRAGVPLISILFLVSAPGFSGCRPQEVTPGPITEAPLSPQRPLLVEAERPLTVEAVLRGESFIWERRCADGGEFIVDLEPLIFQARLTPVPPASWYAEHVRVEGDRPYTLREDLFEHGIVEIRFGQGLEGDRTTITIAQVRLPGRESDSLTVTIVGAEPPRATLEVWEQQVWRPVVPGEILPHRPLRLRVVFSRSMKRETVEPFLLLLRDPEMQLDEYDHRPAPGQVTWLDDRTMLWEIADPPPVLRPSVRLAQDIFGLLVHEGLPVVYTGKPPMLLMWDPVTGLELPVSPVPTDLRRAQVSPSGQALLAWAYSVTTRRLRGNVVLLGDPELVTTRRLSADGVVGILDLSTGRWRWMTHDDRWGNDPSSWRYIGWLDGYSLLRVRRNQYQVIDLDRTVLWEGSLPGVRQISYASPSPDGSSLAFLVADWESPDLEEEPPEYSMCLIVVDLQSGKMTSTPDFVRYFFWGIETSNAVPGWSPCMIYIAGLTELKGGRETAVRVLDRRSGEVHTAVTLHLRLGTMLAFAWSPDGGYWLVGDRLVAAAPPHPSTPARWQQREAPTWWSPDGRWLVGGDWDGARRYGVGTGTVEEIGEALPCGWDAKGRLFLIRWPDAAHRHRELAGY